MKDIIPVTFTDLASVEINKIFEHKNIPIGYGLRVGVKGSGCAGTNFLLGFDLKKKNDLAYEAHGFKVFVDKKDMLYLLGLEVDYVTNNDSTGFTFNRKETSA